jgi:hypothetical protein
VNRDNKLSLLQTYWPVMCRTITSESETISSSVTPFSRAQSSAAISPSYSAWLFVRTPRLFADTDGRSRRIEGYNVQSVSGWPRIAHSAAAISVYPRFHRSSILLYE